MGEDSVDCSSEEYSDISYSDMEEYEGMSFGEIQSGENGLKVSKSERYTCPYCPKKSKMTYLPSELFAHVDYIAHVSSKKISYREKATHRGLYKYLQTDAQPAFKGLGLPEATHEEVQGSSLSKQRQPINKCNKDELLVWPPNGIVVNILIELKGKTIGESGSKLRDDFKSNGYSVRKVKPLWDYKGFSGNPLVQFVELNYCLLFEEDHELDLHEKKDWLDSDCQGSALYPWMAHADNFCADNIIGKYLRNIGDLKTIGGVSEEEERKHKKLKMMLPESN